VMIVAAVACLPIFASGGSIARWEGGLFLAYYAAYVAYLYLDGSGHGVAPTYRWVMLAFAGPLVAVTAAGVVGRERVRGRSSEDPAA
jgi:cation:H+ antiporter